MNAEGPRLLQTSGTQLHNEDSVSYTAHAKCTPANSDSRIGINHSTRTVVQNRSEIYFGFSVGVGTCVGIR